MSHFAVGYIVSNYRHHIHIICDSQDTSLYAWQDTLVMLFDDRVHLTKDLFTTTADTANYSWRCINACDFVFVLLGESYGNLNATGVSQLHISYLNAKTKNKPMVVFIKDQPTPKSKQLTDLISTIKNQLKTIHFVADTDDVVSVFGGAYEELTLGLEDFRPNHAFVAATTEFVAPAPSPTAAANPYTDSHSAHTAPKTTHSLQDDVLLNCTGHAFFGGTLSEVAFIARLTWQEILVALPPNATFGVDGLSRSINELITPQAMPIVRLSNPNIHAISRCQIVKADAIWLQEELVDAGWLQKTPNSSNIRPLWQLTALAKQLLSISEVFHDK